MSGEVVRWPGHVQPTPPCLRERLAGVLAIFTALHQGEFLSALPEAELDQIQHQTAVSLLALAERELVSLWEDADT